jgi:hypothetical protein
MQEMVESIRQQPERTGRLIQPPTTNPPKRTHAHTHTPQIVTTPKAGTTWLQQLCHQLRSKGDMDFVEISAVVPWIELAHDLGQDLDAHQPHGPPRLFKTHCWFEHCPRAPGVKYVVGVRNPEDVLWSFYRFMDGWMAWPAGSIDFDTFARAFFLNRGLPASKMQNASYWHHLVSWMGHVDDPNVCFVFFEDMKEDLERESRRLARFLGYSPEQPDWEERISVAVQHASYGYMVAHVGQFDENITRAARNGPMGLPPEAGAGTSKVKEGKVGGSRCALSPKLREELQRRWEEVVTPALGFGSYEELLQHHRRRVRGGEGAR